MDLLAIEKDIQNDLSLLEDPISQYTYLISCAQELRPFPQEYRLDDNLIRECQVNTWVYAYVEENQQIFLGDSESLIVKGALALLQEIYHNRSINEVRAYHCKLLETESFSRHFTAEQIKGLRAIISGMERGTYNAERKNRNLSGGSR